MDIQNPATFGKFRAQDPDPGNKICRNPKNTQQCFYKMQDILFKVETIKEFIGILLDSVQNPDTGF